MDEFFPEKTVMISYLEKKWMNPHLKNLLRKVKREFYQKRKSPKWRKLKKRFKKLKQKTVRTFYSNFVTDLKASNPSKWYRYRSAVIASLLDWAAAFDRQNPTQKLGQPSSPSWSAT